MTLDVAPGTCLVVVREGNELHVTPGPMVAEFRTDLLHVMHLSAPWLETTDVRDGKEPFIQFALPTGRGVTLHALWQRLDVDERAKVLPVLLRTMLRVPSLPPMPSRGVLLSEGGVMALVPKFEALVARCAVDRWWSDADYAAWDISNYGPTPSHRLATTVSALVEPRAFAPYGRGPLPRPVSELIPQLASLDALVAEALLEIRTKQQPADDVLKRWQTALASLDGEVSSVVARVWPFVRDEERW